MYSYSDDIFKYHYSNEDDISLDFPDTLELKNVTCKSKGDYYEYLEINRTSPEQKFFYLMIESKYAELNYINFKSTFFNEFDYIISNNYSIYEYQLDEFRPTLPVVIGDFEYNEKFYFELEITFPENDTNNNDKDNNIKNIDIYVNILNQKADSYYEFSLENKGAYLATTFSTEFKSYYLYESNIKFNSGVKSLFFFVYHKGKYPNCTIKYGTYKEKPIRYENNSIILNQNKRFNNMHEIFFLSLDLNGISFLQNEYLYISFEGKKDAFSSNQINYIFDNGKVKYNIDGNYLVCEGELKEDEEKKRIDCFVHYKSTKFVNFILYLNKNYEINVLAEKIYKGNFLDYLSINSDRKYIISNNASDNYNYYIFISSDYNFNIEDITYNTIDNLDNFTESYPIKDKKEVNGIVGKRIYININNKDKKSFIGFKTGKISIPFKIIKSKFDESNAQFLNYTEKFKFNLIKNIPLLFLFNFDNRPRNIYFQFISNFKLDYFNNITYFSTSEFDCFSQITNIHEFVENTNKIFYGENKTVMQKQINIKNNLYGMFINQTLEGELEIEILYYNNIYNLDLNSEIPYYLKKGINLINTEINKYSKYNFILKHFGQTNTNNIEIYQTNYSDFISNKTFIDNIIQIDYKNDTKNNTYLYFDFDTSPYLIIFSDSGSKYTLRQSSIKENDIIKYYNLDDKKIEVKNTNKIVLISGININNSYNDIYYFKYIFDANYYDELKSISYIDDEEDLNNIVEFYERRKYNINQLINLKYKDKIYTYLEAYNLRSSGNKTAIFMFDYYNNDNSLIINLSTSKKPFFTHHNINKLENTTIDIFNNVLFIDLNESDFKNDNNSYILFEINGNLSAFNSTQIHINDRNENQLEIFNEFNVCSNKTFNEGEISISCNYTKQNKNPRFMLFLNEGNQINIKNIIPEKIIPSDDEKKEDNENKSFKYFLYIGIPAIVIVFGAIITIIIIKCKNKKLSLDESAKKLDVELIPRNE